MLPNGGAASNRVLTVLKTTGGGLSVKEMCQKLDLSSMAVRRQLAVLEAQDLVFSSREKQKTGRPSQVYYLTDDGHEEFERDYSALAVDLLVGVRSMLGKPKINKLLELRNSTLLEKARRRVKGKTLETRVHEVAQLLTEYGYMADWEKLAPNRYLIKEMNCAVAKVARKFPQVCIFEESFLGEILQARVSRQHHILQKDHFCSYLVEADD